MANVIDYLDWRGDIPFSPDFPFNEADTVALCLFSYLEMEKIALNETETIQSICEKILTREDQHYHLEMDKELAKRLAVSNRLGKLKVTDFEFDRDKEEQEQFAALCVHLPQDEVVMVYRGTDSSVIGWKEDLNMAFMEEVPAQASGLGYATRMAQKYEGERLRLMGHSKGGNVAMYAAFYLPLEYARRIVRVDNLDGPGFAEKVIQENATDDLIPKMHTFFPTDSIIGRLLKHLEDHTVVQSDRLGVYQHDLYSWQILRNKIVRGEGLTQQSEVISGMFTGWLQHSSLEQRAVFADAIYKIYSSTNQETVKEFHRSIIKNAPTILRAYRGMDPKEKKTALEMLVLFGKTFMGSFKDNRNARELAEEVSLEMGEVLREMGDAAAGLEEKITQEE